MDQLPSRSELARRIKECEKQSIRTCIVYGISAFISMFGGMLLGDMLFPGHGHQASVPGLLTSAAGLIVAIICVIKAGRIANKLPAKIGNACPHCNKPLTQMNAKLALTTGRCGSCGEVVISDP